MQGSKKREQGPWLGELHAIYVSLYGIKANVVRFGSRLTFGAAFRWASKICKVGTKVLGVYNGFCLLLWLSICAQVVVSNADIYFDDTIGLLHRIKDFTKKCFCLLRWEVAPMFQIVTKDWAIDWCYYVGNLFLVPRTYNISDYARHEAVFWASRTSVYPHCSASATSS